jgi:hypothetical protein
VVLNKGKNIEANTDVATNGTKVEERVEENLAHEAPVSEKPNGNRRRRIF